LVVIFPTFNLDIQNYKFFIQKYTSKTQSSDNISVFLGEEVGIGEERKLILLTIKKK
jgi:hypothetical protein